MEKEKLEVLSVSSCFIIGFICLTLVIFRMVSCSEQLRMDAAGNRYYTPWELRHLAEQDAEIKRLEK